MASIVRTDSMLKCECGEFYKNVEFNNLCSECYIKKFANEIENNKLFLNLLNNRRYCKKYLDEFTKGRCLPDNHILMTLLKNMFETGSVIQENNFLDWVSYLEGTIYKGISVKQAIELKALSDNSKTQYVKKVLKNEYWKLGHNLCSLIIDWWNLPNERLCRVQCYYHKVEKGDLPKIKNTQIQPAAIFDTKCCKKDCKNHGNHVKNCSLDHNEMLYFTIKNIAKNC